MKDTNLLQVCIQISILNLTLYRLCRVSVFKLYGKQILKFSYQDKQLSIIGKVWGRLLYLAHLLQLSVKKLWQNTHISAPFLTPDHFTWSISKKCPLCLLTFILEAKIYHFSLSGVHFITLKKCKVFWYLFWFSKDIRGLMQSCQYIYFRLLELWPLSLDNFLIEVLLFLSLHLNET